MKTRDRIQEPRVLLELGGEIKPMSLKAAAELHGYELVAKETPLILGRITQSNWWVECPPPPPSPPPTRLVRDSGPPMTTTEKKIAASIIAATALAIGVMIFL